jgi:pyruvate dehydrogenase E1 component beta subunit
VEILFVDFTLLAMDQIINQAAKYRFITAGDGAVPLVIRTQGGVGGGLAAQHSQSLEALFYHIPGLKIAVPSTPSDTKGLLKTAIRCDDPVIFIEHKRLYETEGHVPSGEFTIPFGKADIKRMGSDVTIIAWSDMVRRSLEVAESLEEEGISAEVVDPRTLVPLDIEAILSSVRKTGRAVIVQEAVRRGGVASDISSMIQELLFHDLAAPVSIVAGMNTPVPFNESLESKVIPQTGDIIEAVRKIMDNG